MKKLLFIATVASIFLSSCSGVDSTIVGRDILTDSTKYDPSVIDPTTNKPEVVLDSVYLVRPSYSEKVKLAEHNGTLVWFVILGLVGVVLIGIGSYLGYNQKNASDNGYIALFFVGIMVIAGAFGAIGWAGSKEGTIQKTVYQENMNANGNLSDWWIDEGNLFK